MRVYLKDNFISKKECHDLIEFFNKYFKNHGIVFDDRKIINLQNICIELSDDNFFNDADLIKSLNSRLEHNIRSIDENAFINYSHITVREKDNFQAAHKDFDHHAWTSILYLNADFAGGETCVEEETIPPTAGSLLTFQGNKLKHEVLPVTSGVRYTVLVWYKSLSFKE
jgi:hypothetical protein